MSEPSVKKELVTLILTWIVVVLGIRIFAQIPFISDYQAEVIFFFLLYPPVILSIMRKERITYWRLDKQNIILSLKVLFIISLIIFPASFLVNHFYQKIFFGMTYHAGSSDIWVNYILYQLVLVSFPEEFFFRGFMQESLNKILPAKRKLFGVPFGLSAIIVSAVFALSHSLITLQWWHGFIFFPALVFSWLKDKTGTIWTAVFFHGACNLFAYWVAIHY